MCVRNVGPGVSGFSLLRFPSKKASDSSSLADWLAVGRVDEP